MVTDMVAFICISLLIGLFLSLFYKKSFSFKDEGLKDVRWTVLAVIQHIIVVCAEDALGTLGTIFSICSLLQMTIALSRAFYHMEKSERIKAVVISITILLSATTNREMLGIGAALVAITQFLRKPNKWKNALSTCRIMFGPVYVVLMAAGGVQFIDSHRLCSSAVSLTTALSPLTAAIFFRPDNFEVLKLVCPYWVKDLRPPRIRSIHGLLMFYSLLAVTLNSLWPPETRWIALADIILYLLLSDFPKMFRKLATYNITKNFSFFIGTCFNQVA